MAVLYVIATPIGNLGDITYRAVRTLSRIEALACEDTRRTRRIFDHYAIPAPKTILSYHEHNEEKAGARILGFLTRGIDVALASNAGYPGVSDPGYRIISRAWEEGHEVQVIPGAGAVEAALVSSGLPTSSYLFRGFPPRKSGRRRRFLAEERDAPHTLVLFESPQRVAATLRDAAAVLGNRMAAVCVELTKKFERVHRGGLEQLAEQCESKPLRGEVTLVIAGSNPKFLVPEKDADGSGPAAERNE